MFIIKIPVSKPVKKFLTHKYGEPFVMNRKSWFGIMLFNVLKRKKEFVNYTYNGTKFTNEEYYEIKISEDGYLRMGLFLLEQKLQKLSFVLEYIFREMIFEKALMDYELYGSKFKTTILNTLIFYGVDNPEDYFEKIRRDFYRFQKKNNEKFVTKKHKKNYEH